jgi:hypothetical protein
MLQILVLIFTIIFLIRTEVFKEGLPLSAIIVFLGQFLTYCVAGIFSMFFGYVECGIINIETPIASLKNVSGINGDFFLGFGNIKGVENYSYYRKTDSGGYIKEYIPVNEWVIFEDSNDNPHISHKIITGKWNKWFIIFQLPSTHEIQREIHVPKNTILKEFSLD